MQFEKRNVNPKNKRTGDCVVRAIAVATSQDYTKVMRDLFELGMGKGFVFNDQRTYEYYLKELGWIKHNQPRNSNNGWVQLRELDNFTPLDDVVLVTTRNHMTVIVDGTVIDTFNPQNQYVMNYWTKSDVSKEEGVLI